MSKGRRYDAEPKLNIKKVFAVIIAILVIVMFVFIIKGILEKGNDTGKIVSQDYFVAFKDNKWGVIDLNGNVVIDPSYQEMIVVPNSKSDVFLCTYDVNYETGEYKTKALNSKNESILEGYEKVEAIPNYDNSQNVWYEENVLRVQKDSKYGLIDLSGKELLKSEYEEILPISGIKNALKVKKDGKYGVVDNAGKEIVSINYIDITNLGKDNKAGYIVKSEDGKYGVVDYSNKKVLDTIYDGIEKVHTDSLYVVKVGTVQKLIDKDGNEVLSQGFDSVVEISKGKEDGSGVIFIKDNKYGFMKLSQDVIIPNTYDELTEAKTGILIAKKGKKYGVIDLTQAEKIPFEYNSISYEETSDIYVAEDSSFNSNIFDSNFESKLSGILVELNTQKGYIKLRTEEDYKYYNFKFEEKSQMDIFTSNTLFLSKKDGKYGFVDKNQNVVIDYIYDDATNQNSFGFAGIKKDGKWGSIDNKGNVVIEPTYNLDEYLKIDFIGKWHAGKDINMNYYSQQ